MLVTADGTDLKAAGVVILVIHRDTRNKESTLLTVVDQRAVKNHTLIFIQKLSESGVPHPAPTQK